MLVYPLEFHFYYLECLMKLHRYFFDDIKTDKCNYNAQNFCRLLKNDTLNCSSGDNIMLVDELFIKKYT